jgi:hypothetical protein
MNLAARTLPLLLAACLLACGEDAASTPANDAGNVIDVVADGGEGPDSADVTEVEIVEEPALILGVNQVLQKHPSAFTPLEDGDHLEIQLGGFNGLWMVVIAFKTRGYFPGRVIVFADVSVDGKEISSLSLSKQSLEPGGDGGDYYYDLFLIANDTSVGGQEAIVDLTVRDYEGKEFEVSIQKKLLVVGGDPPYWP